MNIVFSYDCEGHWGFIDWDESPLSPFSPKELSQAYKTLVDLHVESKVPATFAFVGLFALPPNERRQFVQENLKDLHSRLPNLFESGGLWEGHEILKSVSAVAAENNVIEIGSHGLTHVPITTLNPEQQEREFKESKSILESLTGVSPPSFIFPRNMYNDGAACLESYKSFRDTPAVKSSQRIGDLIRTVSGIDIHSKNSTSDFVFWKSGKRKHFSERGWKRLWLSRMKKVTSKKNQNRTIHVWSHPHNLLTDSKVESRLKWLMDLLNDNREHIAFSTLGRMKHLPQNVPARNDA